MDDETTALRLRVQDDRKIVASALRELHEALTEVIRVVAPTQGSPAFQQARSRLFDAVRLIQKLERP